MQQIYVLLVILIFKIFMAFDKKNTWILIQKYHVSCYIIDQKKNNSFK